MGMRLVRSRRGSCQGRGAPFVGGSSGFAVSK